jgi:Zn-dependent protease
VKTSRTMKSLIVGALAAVLFTVSLGRADAFLDKTRFVAHLGVAYFCFHHWVLRPYQHGDYADGAPHRVSTIVKGGAALLFAVHEVRVAEKIAKNSPDPLLQKLDGGLTDLTASFGAIGAKLKSGHFDPADIMALKGKSDAVAAGAAADGATIKDVPVPVPN